MNTDARNLQVRLRRRPTGLPDREDFELVEGERPTPGHGQLLIRTIYASIDPAMRGWVVEGPNYVQTVPIGSVMRSFGLGEVVESNHSAYLPGTLVVALTGWQQWSALDPVDVIRVVQPTGAPLTASLGVLGISGVTAYIGIVEIGRPQPGETVLISTAAGSVGSAAGQIAAVQGARVVGLTGTQAKQRLCLDTFGFDQCINYRDAEDLSSAIADACPGGVDVYFDSVGGPTLDAVIPNLNVGGRIAVCGTISEPAGAVSIGPRLGRALLVKRLIMQGFLATDHVDRYPEIVQALEGWVNDQRLAYLQDISEGVATAPAALERLLSGSNLGKSIVRVGPEPHRISAGIGTATCA